MNKFITFLLFTSFVVSPVMVSAQTVVFDNNTANDEIVQLNNLTITNVQSGYAGSVALVTAQSPGLACLKYFDSRASAGFAYPCPAQTSYQIRLQSNTILLMRNRVRANISDFAVGDQINVYGFLDANGINLDALIMRDLTKPIVRRYIQINNATVQADPGSGVPTSFVITQQTDPCFDYSVGRASNIICPMGLEQRDASAGQTSLYYPYARKYQVNVSANTALLYRDRRYMPISEIEVGDKVNVYGSFDGNGNIDALIVRDLSRPAVVIVPPPGNQAPVITSVSGPTNLSVNQTGTWTISAYDSDGGNLTYTVTWGDEVQYGYANQSAPAQTNVQTGTFTHSYANAGSYTVKFNVTDSSGLSAVSTLTVQVGGVVSSAPMTRSLSPANGQIGTTVTVYGSGFTGANNIVYFGAGAVANINSNDGSTLYFTVPQYLSPYCPAGAMCPMYAIQIMAGNYQVSIGNTNGRSNELTFTVR